jgi:uncharacterized protein (DUF2384 family)
MKGNAKEEFDNLLHNHQDIKKEVLELFKKKEAALAWLKQARPQLLGVSPASLLNTDKTKVKDLIHRIKIGDLS